MSRIIYTPEIKKKKDRFSKKIVLGVGLFFLFALFLGIAIYLSTLPIFRIEQYEINGNRAIEKNEIESGLNNALSGFYFYFIPRKNYFLVTKKSIEKNLLGVFPRVEEVSIEKKPFRGLLIQIKEREPWAVYCSQKCFFIDKSGFAYEESFINSGNLIRLIRGDDENIFAGKYALHGKIISIFSDVEDKINLLELGPVIEYGLSSKSPEELKIKTGGGFYLIFNLNDDRDKIFTVLETVLNEEIKEKRWNLEYIDLRFGNKVFYKYKTDAK